MSANELMLLVMMLILGLPFLIWRGINAPNLFPLVVVQILCGILLGPGVFGALLPDLHSAIFRPEVITALNGIAIWAVVLFVFLAGLELDLADLGQNKRETGITAGLALIVPFILGSLVAAVMLRGSGWAGPNGTAWQTVLAFGMSCAVTALPILVLFLDRLGILREPLGQRVLRYASLDDIAIWSVLALILLDWDRVARQGFFAVGFLIAAILLRRWFTRLRSTDRWPVALIWLTICAFVADWAGLHYMVGAFVAGAVLDMDWFEGASVDRMREVVLLVLMPVFFLSTGLKTSWEMGGPMVFAAAAALLIAAVVGKLAGVHFAGRILGWPQGQAAIIGWLLQTKALITIVFANILLDKGIISSAGFTALLLMAIVSTMLTMPIVAKRLDQPRRK
jgi:Kef-type K+ transport system membrane component KefB